MYQTKMLSTLYLHSGICQLYLNLKRHTYKTGNNNKKISLLLCGEGWGKLGQTSGTDKGWWQSWWEGAGLRTYFSYGFHIWKQDLVTKGKGNWGLLSEVVVRALGGSVGWSIGWYTKSLQVWSPIRVRRGGNWSVCFSLSRFLSPTPSRINEHILWWGLKKKKNWWWQTAVDKKQELPNTFTSCSFTQLFISDFYFHHQ